jgi:flagellar basal body rod protein FlgG
MKRTRPLLAPALLLLAACQSTQGPASNAARATAGLTARLESPGFLTFTDAAGRTVYTRDATFALSPDRELATSDGALLASPRIVVPCEATLIQIDGVGIVTAWIDGEALEIGRLEVIAFANPERLTALGHGRFTPAVDAPDGFTLIPLPDAPARIAATAANPATLADAGGELSPGSE